MNEHRYDVVVVGSGVGGGTVAQTLVPLVEQGRRAEWITTLEGRNPAFDLLIVDVGRLEEGGGHEALTGSLATLSVIFTSRLGERALDRHEGLWPRGVFLPKSVQPDVLRDAISRATLRGSGPSRSEQHQEA